MVNTYRKKVDEALQRHRFLSREKKGLDKQLIKGQTLSDELEKASAVMRQAAKLSQEHLAVNLSGIVTKAIQAVINKPYEFKVEFVERRGVTECDLYVTKHGFPFNILGGTGGGLADTCSFALKVAYLLLSDVDNILIIDEIARHINSADQRVAFANVVKTLCEEFNIQLITNTTVDEILAIADRTFLVTQTDEVSHVREI